MNNLLCCQCLDCGNHFVIGLPELVEQSEPQAVIGDVVWCGFCDSHSYTCHWGLFATGDSTDSIKDVTQMWREWTHSYLRSWRGQYQARLQETENT